MAKLTKPVLERIADEYPQVTLLHDHGSPRWRLENKFTEESRNFTTRALTEEDIHRMCKELTASNERLMEARDLWSKKYMKGVVDLTRYIEGLPDPDDVATVNCGGLHLPHNLDLPNPVLITSLFNKIAKADALLE